MSGPSAEARRVLTGVTGCRIEIPEGRVVVEGTDGVDGSLDIRGLDHGHAGASRQVPEDELVVAQDAHGAVTIRLAEVQRTWARWLPGDRRPRPTIDLRLPRAARVIVETVGADVRVTGCQGGQEVATVTGDATIDQAQGVVVVRTVSGSIAITGTSLDAQAATTSGRVRVAGRSVEALQVRSVSGRVDVTGRLAAGPDHRIESLSGDVSLISAGGVRIVARTISGRLVADGGARRESHAGIVSLVAGDGTALAHVTTVSGDVRLTVDTGEPAALEGVTADGADPMLDALEALARGDISVEEADRRLEVLHG